MLRYWTHANNKRWREKKFNAKVEWTNASFLHTHLTPERQKWTSIEYHYFSDQTLKPAPFLQWKKSGCNRSECNSCIAQKVKTGLNLITKSPSVEKYKWKWREKEICCVHPFPKLSKRRLRYVPYACILNSQYTIHKHCNETAIRSHFIPLKTNKSKRNFELFGSNVLQREFK